MIISYLRTIILYLLLLVVIRLMGKRQVGQMEPAEFVVTIIAANLATIPMQDGGVSLFSGFVPLLTILGTELVLSAIAMRSIPLRRILCGKPVILVESGHILQENLRRTRITLDELTGLLRQKDILDLASVQFAILETNGNVSVFPYARFQPAAAKDAGIRVKDSTLPVTLISDGYLLRGNLSLAKKDENWVYRVLEEKKNTVSGTWLLTVDKNDHILYIPKEGSL